MKPFLKTIIVFALFSFACSANPARFQTGENTDKSSNIHREINTTDVIALPALKLTEDVPTVKRGPEKNGIQSYQIGNLTLIHKHTPNSPVVSARLYLDGGVNGVTENTEGLDQFAMQVAVNGGTKNTPKSQFNSKLDAIGAGVYAFTDLDYVAYGLSTLAQNLDVSWPLFVEAVMQPAMPEDEIEFTREQQLAEIASRGESADNAVSEQARDLLFQGHPYRFHLNGNTKSVSAFTKSQLIKRQREMLNSKSLLLVVVGAWDSADLLKKVQNSFAKIESKPTVSNPTPFVKSDTFKTGTRKLPTHYVLGYYEAPAPSHEDYTTMLITTSYLHDRLFEEVRTKRNLTYAVSAGMSSRRQNYGYLYVTAVDVPTTMKVIFDQVNELKTLEVPKADLEETVNVFITSYYRSLETNSEQASFLAKWHLKTGSWTNSQNILDKIKRVTPADIKRVSAKYFNDYRFSVVGPTSPDASLFTGK